MNNSTPYQINGYPEVLPNFENIPDELKVQPFAVWKAQAKEGGGYNKIPCHPVTGRYLKTSEPDTWGTFAQAKAAYEQGGWSGIGLLLTGNGIVGFDIDKATQVLVVRPEIKQWLIDAVESGAYAERSPSGNGFRVFVRGALPAGSKKRGDSVEIYDDVRFLTLTGCVVEVEEVA